MLVSSMATLCICPLHIVCVWSSPAAAASRLVQCGVRELGTTVSSRESSTSGRGNNDRLRLEPFGRIHLPHSMLERSCLRERVNRFHAMVQNKEMLKFCISSSSKLTSALKNGRFSPLETKEVGAINDRSYKVQAAETDRSDSFEIPNSFWAEAEIARILEGAMFGSARASLGNTETPQDSSVVNPDGLDERSSNGDSVVADPEVLDERSSTEDSFVVNPDILNETSASEDSRLASLAAPGTPQDSVVMIPEVLDESGSKEEPVFSLWGRVLRIRITGSNGSVKLDVQIPAGFLEGLSKTIPGFAGVNVQELLDDAIRELRGNLKYGQILLDFTDSGGNRVEVFLQ